MDTGFFIALAQPNDALHECALAWADHLSGPFILTEHVLCEVVNALSDACDRAKAQEIVIQVMGNPEYEIVWASRELFTDGMRLYQERQDKDWSLTDCISFQVMENLKIRTALAYDRHFEQAGFEALLRTEPTD